MGCQKRGHVRKSLSDIGHVFVHEGWADERGRGGLLNTMQGIFVLPRLVEDGHWASEEEVGKMGTTLERLEKNQIWKNRCFKALAQCKESQDRCGLWIAQKTLLGKKTNKRTHLWADDEEEEADEDEND